jgi:SAM-dependent methyltransferase
MSDLPEYVKRNRTSWDEWAREYVAAGRENWSADEPSWGIWHVPESEVGMFPGDLEGKDAIELGCGTAYGSLWLTQRGAKPVGIDNSEAQLATARALQEEHGVEFPLLHGNAESVPFPDESFDFALSEYGASIWADPYKWIPEAARLLRPGGHLSFLVNAPLLMLCVPEYEGSAADETLKRPYFGMHRIDWPDDDSVEFHLPHGEMIALLRDTGFEVEALVELRPPEGSTTTYDFVTLDWARRWPSEEVWRARKRPLSAAASATAGH